MARALMQVSQESLDAAFEYGQAVWVLEFDPKRPCRWLWVNGGTERASVCAVLVGMGKDLPDGWRIRAAPPPSPLECFDLGCGVERLAAHGGFVPDLMRSVWRSGWQGRLRKAGSREGYDFRDLGWLDEIRREQATQKGE